MAIRIAQYKGKSFISSLIKFVTWGTYSHTAIMLSDTEIVEAWEGSNSVRIIRGLDDGHKIGTSVDIYSVELTEEQEAIFREFVAEQIGKKYDFWGIAGFLVRRSIQTKGSWFCSELFAAACIAAGAPLLNDRKPYQISPQMVISSPRTKLLQSLVV